jgi:hypothetical protein
LRQTSNYMSDISIPRPWSVSKTKDDDGRWRFEINASPDWAVADVCGREECLARAEANANLIVRAVNEYEALKAIAEAAKDLLSEFEKTRVMVGADLSDSLRVLLKPAMAELEKVRWKKR